MTESKKSRLPARDDAIAKRSRSETAKPAKPSSVYIIEDRNKTARSETPTPASPFWKGLGRLLFRLFLLGIGGSVAAIAGILLAIAYPRPNSDKPFILQGWDFLNEQRQSAAMGSSASDGLPSVSLTREEKQQLQNELNSVQREYNSLRDRARELEKRLSLPSTASQLPERLQAIDGSLRKATTLVGSTAISLDSPSSASDRVKVTLPADILFTPQNTLSPDADLILDTVLTDLQRYPSSTLRIAVHTDATGQPQESRERSFRQAGILKDYLKEKLGDNYRWVTVGYGRARPLVPSDTDINRQRNRRVEISID
ncbi:MAG: OmpA family protein [Cyanobacteriota bacterium]|nr:OmpA family protein [Cyanobacteriota bacterium]